MTKATHPARRRVIASPRAGAEAHDAFDQCLRQRVLVFVGQQFLLLLRVRQESELDEHGRHVRADKHPERPLLNRARGHRRPLAERALHRAREGGGLVDIARLREFPGNDLEIARAPAEDRQRVAWGLRRALRRFAIAGEIEVEHFGARHCRAERRVGVQADEEIGLVVVGDGRALIEADVLIGVTREQDARPQP